MALITTWQVESDWNTWINIDSFLNLGVPDDVFIPTGGTLSNDPRIINDAMNLAFEPSIRQSTHIGVRDFNTQDNRTLLRFGQVWTRTKSQAQSITNWATEATPDGRDMLVPASSANQPEFTTLGMLNVNKNKYVDRNIPGGGLNQPKNLTGFQVSLWFKSTATDYSANRGIIVAYLADVTAGQIGWSILINTSNNIVAVFSDTNGTADQVVTPVGGNVEIDTNWHNATLLIESIDGDSNYGAILIIDNNLPSITATELTFTTLIGSGHELSIGGTRHDTTAGFAGYIDEVGLHFWRTVESTSSATIASLSSLPDRHRYAAYGYASPVVDTGEDDSLLSSILADYDSPNGSGIQFSFRASNTIFVAADPTGTLNWTGFTALGQIVSQVESNTEAIGVITKGRYHQVRVRMVPSTILSPTPDPLQIDTPSLNSLTLNTSRNTVLLNASKSAFIAGTIQGQTVAFAGSKRVDKVTLELTVNASDRKTFVEGKSGTVSFQASNFQKSRSDWVFQPEAHFGVGGWSTSGTAIRNSGQNIEYLESADALSNAPSLGYKLFFPEGGTYDLWGYGIVEDDGIFYTFDSDVTHIRSLNFPGTAGNPSWTKFGSVFFEEGGIHEFDVYLRGLHSVILDQWYFTKNHNLENDLASFNGLLTPLPLSESPFMTVVRLRSLANGQVDSLSNPGSGAASVTAWMNNQNVAASGKFNYEIRDSEDTSGVTFTDGLSLEFWQIGGSADNFASWDISFPDNSIGSPFVSEDFGQTYE